MMINISGGLQMKCSYCYCQGTSVLIYWCCFHALPCYLVELKSLCYVPSIRNKIMYVLYQRENCHSCPSFNIVRFPSCQYHGLTKKGLDKQIHILCGLHACQFLLYRKSVTSDPALL